MFSKNNHLLTDRQCTHQNPKFALRKLSIGVASVLLGTIFLMGEANVQADTVTDANQENPVIATTTADTQNKSTSKRNIDQAKQLINNQTTVVENEKPANPLPDYKPITYVNYDAVSIYPANDAQGNPSVYVKDHIFDNVHKPGDRVYDFIKGANGWSSGVYYYHQNKQHTAGYHALTPVDANDRSKGYQVPDFEADILGGERIALDKDGHLIGAYPGESHYSSMAPGAAVNTYITLHPDRQRAEINFLDQTTNSSLGKVVLWGYSGVQSQFKVDDLLAKLKSLGFEVTSSDFQNGFHYDSTNNDYYSSSDPNQ
ncbi:YSIRK-type signal peptide-containing protein [Limosilactobacillus portuensis]|uniref:YSIRK-type signal peptide-containing protein n=1 Tax=Limosilactobacillus portuensis TaxID=2742601 RepID=A0ABS6ITI6_9LACO|nr:YSIRK-type signal peptide-containing protein [Limosilactobacillus portuensis]MBU9694612.1 YSIRK-type signal peptide-containing protein [Limosilactobacillus portuensis]